MPQFSTSKFIHNADNSLMHIVYDLIGINIVLTIITLAFIVAQFALRNIIVLLTKSNLAPISYRKIAKSYGYFLISGVTVGAFFFLWWEWQSSECAFGYGLIKYSQFCFENELNIFPVGFGTLLLSQSSLFVILLLFFNKKLN